MIKDIIIRNVKDSVNKLMTNFSDQMNNLLMEDADYRISETPVL